MEEKSFERLFIKIKSFINENFIATFIKTIYLS